MTVVQPNTVKDPLRVQIGRIGGLIRASRYDGREVTEKARKTFLDSFEAQVDPDGTLPPEERTRRAQALRKAHMHRLALRSAQVRRQQAGKAVAV